MSIGSCCNKCGVLSFVACPRCEKEELGKDKERLDWLQKQFKYNPASQGATGCYRICLIGDRKESDFRKFIDYHLENEKKRKNANPQA